MEPSPTAQLLPTRRSKDRLTRRQLLNKVPEITIFFWIVKVLCTTVGETAADRLNNSLGLGLGNTTWVMVGALVLVLVGQFWTRRYVPGVYWLAVVMISVVGTLITDNMTDRFNISLITSTIAFAIALAAAFGVWFWSERSLSIHTIVTRRREAFYWAVVLFTFALGTATGDLMAERLSLGYWESALIFAGAIAVVYLAARFGLNAIAAFWSAYILTRPLGASIGDYLSQDKGAGGLGLGTTTTSVLFLGAILLVVVYLSLSRRDRIADLVPGSLGLPGSTKGRRRVLVVSNASIPNPALLRAVHERAQVGNADFVVLAPNPVHHVFDQIAPTADADGALRASVLPAISEAAGGDVPGAVAAGSNLYDDIELELQRNHFDEIIVEDLGAHHPHFRGADVPSRIAALGYPLTVVPGPPAD